MLGWAPIAQSTKHNFRDNIHNLKHDINLKGLVINFGDFIALGIHQDGRVYIFQLADRLVRDSKEIVKVGQVATVRVLEVDKKRKRISLLPRSGGE